MVGLWAGDTGTEWVGELVGTEVGVGSEVGEAECEAGPTEGAAEGEGVGVGASSVTVMGCTEALWPSIDAGKHPLLHHAPTATTYGTPYTSVNVALSRPVGVNCGPAPPLLVPFITACR